MIGAQVGTMWVIALYIYDLLQLFFIEMTLAIPAENGTSWLLRNVSGIDVC